MYNVCGRGQVTEFVTRTAERNDVRCLHICADSCVGRCAWFGVGPVVHVKNACVIHETQWWFGFQSPAPTALEIPRPTPTAIAMTRTPIRILTIILFCLLNLARHWHERWLTLAALAFFFQCFWSGHTWPSGHPFRSLLLVLFIPYESSCTIVRVDIMASRSVSKGFRSLWAVAGVETSEGRGEGTREREGDGVRASTVVVVAVAEVLSVTWVTVVTVSLATFSSIVVEEAILNRMVNLTSRDTMNSGGG